MAEVKVFLTKEMMDALPEDMRREIEEQHFIEVREQWRVLLIGHARAAFPEAAVKDDISYENLLDHIESVRPEWSQLTQALKLPYDRLEDISFFGGWDDLTDRLNKLGQEYNLPGFKKDAPELNGDKFYGLKFMLLMLSAMLQVEFSTRDAKVSEREKALKQRRGKAMRAPIGDLFDQDYLSIPNGIPCYDLSYAIAHKELFKTDDSQWPIARIEREQSVTSIEIKPENKGVRLSAEQELYAQNQMMNHLAKMSDLDADVLDALMAIWIKSTRLPQDDCIAHIDDILELRRLEKKKSGSGRRGGYSASQRAEHLEAIFRLEHIWIEFDGPVKYEGKYTERDIISSRTITISDMKGQRRLDGQLDVESILFRPGRIYGAYLMTEGRQTALLAAKALQYDPYRQAPEKRLTRYLAWQWRIRAKEGNYLQPFTIGDLLKEANITITPNKPERTKNRLEEALNCLEADGTCNEWHYEGWDEKEESAGRDRLPRGWWQRYIAAKAIIEPPDIIPDHYKHLERHRPISHKAKTAPIGAQLAEERKNRRLSQAVTAEEIGITQAYLSLIERGKANITPALKKKIQNWIQTQL